jgi:hypothetical protein
MNVHVSTGATRPPRDASLAGSTMQTAQGETVLLLLEVQAGKADAKSLEHECVAIIRHALAETEGDAGQRLDGALKELNGLIKGMLVAGGIDDLHMIAAIVDRSGGLHVSHAGRGEAYLVRKGVASQITEYTSGKPTPAFVHISSGQLEERDIVICASQRLLRTLTPAQLAQMANQPDKLLHTLARSLEADGEHASLGLMIAPHEADSRAEAPSAAKPSALGGRARRPNGRTGSLTSRLRGASPQLKGAWSKASPLLGGLWDRVASLPLWRTGIEFVSGVFADLANPKRKKRAHLLLLAGAVALLLVAWVVVHLFTFSQRSKTRAELETLVEKIDADVQAAENQRLMGDIERANQILLNAENTAKQVIDNESGLFGVEANNLLLTIRAKREEINNVVRLPSPQEAANLAAKNADIAAEGLIGLEDGEFVAYDRQDAYRILLNTVEDPTRVSDEQLILDGEYFVRADVLTFLMTGNSLVELSGGQATTMKTEDPAGWVNGIDMETYLRFLYILSPENKQIYKYERLGGRYGRPVQYNVNGDLTGALDMAIDGDVYVLKEGGQIVRLFRGEAQNFKVSRAPEGVLEDATKLVKVAEKNFYLLDPEAKRVIVLSDGGQNGESSYVKQYVLEGDQVGELKDLFVDAEETRLYVLDEKRVYVVDISAR